MTRHTAPLTKDRPALRAADYGYPDWLIIFQTAFAVPEIRKFAAIIAQERGLRLAAVSERHNRLMADAMAAKFFVPATQSATTPVPTGDEQ